MSTDSRPIPSPVDLVGALLAGLLLIVPLRAALSTTTYGALLAWLLVAAVLMVGFAFLLRPAGISDPFALTLATAGAFAVTTLVMLGAVAIIGDPGDHTAVAVLAGLPAAALSAPIASAVVRNGQAADGVTALPMAVFVCAGGLFIAMGAGPSLGEAVADAREDAAEISELEAAGLTPYLPEIDGMDVEYSGALFLTPEGGGRQLTGYSLRYEPESASDQDWDTAYISVDIGMADPAAECEAIEDLVECREGAGYVVTERDGIAEEVSADGGSVRMRARLTDKDGKLPDIDDIGKALAGAEETEWDDVVGTRE